MAKVLLGIINIIDPTSPYYVSSNPEHPDGYTNFEKVSIIVCLWDDVEERLEIFDTAEVDLALDALGFSGSLGYVGDFYNPVENYKNTFVNQYDLPSGSNMGGITLKDDRVYVLSRDVDIVYVFEKDSSAVLPDEEIDVSAASGSMRSMGIVGDRLYVLTGIGVFVWDISNKTSPARAASEDFGSGVLTNALNLFFDETNTRVHITDFTDDKVYVFDYTDGTRKASEEYGDSTETNGPVDIHIYGTYSYVTVTQGSPNKVAVFDISDGSRVSSADLNGVGLPQSITITNEKAYVGNPGNDKIQVFDISTVTSPVEITSEEILLAGAGELQSLSNLDSYLYISDDQSSAVFRYSTKVFPLCLPYPLFRDRTSPNIGEFWERSHQDYSFVKNGRLFSFQPYTSPPYYILRSVPLLPDATFDGVNDLRAGILSFSRPTAKRTANGSITLTATGENTPFTYQIIGQNNSNDSPQASPTFNNLYPGRYNFRVIDANGIKVDIPTFTLGYIATNDQFPNYGDRWFLTYYDNNNDTNQQRYYRVQIVERGYTGGSSSIQMGPEPITLSTRAEGGVDITEIDILSTNADIVLKADSQSDFTEFIDADDEQFGVIHSVWNGASWEILWKGFISPRSYSRDFSASSAHYVFLTATDRTGDLSHIDYKAENQFSSFIADEFFGADKDQLSVLLFCLNRLNLYQGVRVALPRFETNHNKTATDSPLEQTFVDTDSYFEENEDTWTMERVVKNILRTHNAILVSYRGYWYIIDKRSFEKSSISYVQFDSEGTQDGTGSWNPIVDLKGISQTNKFIWAGGNVALNTTEPYKEVELTLDTKPKRHLTNPFDNRHLLTKTSSGYITFDTFSGYLVKQNNSMSMAAYRLNGTKVKEIESLARNEDLQWGINMEDFEKSLSYIVASDNVQYSGSDAIRLKIRYRTTSRFDIVMPYYVMKWELKVGDLWFNDQTDKWETSTATNQVFITTFDKFEDFETIIPLRQTGRITEKYQLRIYPPSLYEYDIDHPSSQAGMLALLKAVSTVNLDSGSRIICRFDAGNAPIDFRYYFYELRRSLGNGPEPDIVQPSDYDPTTNPKRWRLIKLIGITQAGPPALKTFTLFNAIDLDFLPNGEEIPDEIKIRKTGQLTNKITFKRELEHFDAPPETNNSAKIYFNHLRLGDGTPTSLWAETSGDISRRLQDHFVNYLIEKTRKSRYLLRSDFLFDTEVGPIHVLRNAGDDNRKYFLTGTTMKFKDRMGSGEMVEITNDNVTGTSSFDDGFVQNETS